MKLISFTGPVPLPFLGTLVQMAKAGPAGYLGMYQLCLKHGKMVTVWIGGTKAVVVSDKEDLKVQSRYHALRPQNLTGSTLFRP